ATSRAFDRCQLRLCRASGTDGSALRLEVARGPGDALAHVPGARRHHALPQLGRLQLQDRVQRSAKLERADRLQVLELQVDRRRRISAVAKEWGTDDPAREALLRDLDLLEGDQN